ncbi:hypothetical protein SAMN05216223_11053 [Actinacidiphila yanglinensis]|uniref:Uncharacterized protein n=2 Tax=Actinacidiphila yanglinensis TaxID=310779 RepID=A0A1H6CUB4_9ACTN|nr:hypothetical protein SAMN05216223_11053 [Actinacidiphila yanglinensis]
MMHRMFELSTSRSFDRAPGEGFRTTLELPGWENQSAWGYDEPIGSYFAQLYRNTTPDGERPDIWLSGAGSNYARPGSIALEVLRSTGHDPLTIVSAMGILDPTPRLRGTAEINEQITELTPEAEDRYTAGQIEALRWVLTGACPGPGSEREWLSGPPGAQHVEAEYHLVVGGPYERGGDQMSLSGADEALMWALERM